MTTYRLTIERVEPMKEEEITRQRDEQRRYGHAPSMAGAYENVTRALLVTLTESEFAAVKKAALEVFA